MGYYTAIEKNELVIRIYLEECNIPNLYMVPNIVSDESQLDTIKRQLFNMLRFQYLTITHPEEELVALLRKMKEATKGAVLVSPAISSGEKAVMRAAFERGFPLIILQENGFTDLAKPGGKRMEACAKGRLLILAPWEHHNERIAIRRDQSLSLNEMARILCSVNCCNTAIDKTGKEMATNNEEGV